MSLIVDKLFETILNVAKNNIEGYKNNREFEKLFVTAGDFFKDSAKKSELANDLSLAFSEVNLKQLAQGMKDVSGFEFYDHLYKSLNELMKDYEIPETTANTYIYNFMQVIIREIEKNDSEKRMEIFLKEMRNEEKENHNKIIDKLNDINCNNKEKSYRLSINDINNQLKEKSIYEKMGLDFFKLDDSEFEKKFENLIASSRERIFIVARSKEEATYMVLNKLKDNFNDKNIIIIKSEKDWNLLSKEGIKGAILVPDFRAEEINTISDNINIFIYEEDEPCYSKEKLLLRKRTIKTIRESYKELGEKSEKIEKIINRTHGLYVPMKKYLFKSAYHIKHDWVKSHSRVIMTALLCGKWTDNEGDKFVIKRLSDKNYDEYMSVLNTYMHRDDPYVLEHNSFSEKNIQLACVDDAWEELSRFVSEDLLKIYVNILDDIMSENYAKSCSCSETLKNGMIRTLIMCTIYKTDIIHQRDIDRIVKQILKNCNSSTYWRYISKYLPDLSEASPKSVIEKIEDEFKNPQGMIDLFVHLDREYIDIIRTLEKLSCYQDYVFKAINCLWKLNELNVKYNISNNPGSSLNQIFCSWYNMVPLSVKEKKELVKQALKKYKSAWDIVFNSTTLKGGSLVIFLTKPYYRSIDEIPKYEREDILNLEYEYRRLCIDNIGNDAKRWITLLDKSIYMKQDETEQILKLLPKNYDEMNDTDREKVKTTIRNLISHYRKYVKDETPTELLYKYERLLDELKFNNPIYDYLYVFTWDMDYPLLNPAPYKSESYQDNNDKLVEEAIRGEFYDFKNRNLDIESLIQLAIKNKKTYVGEIIANYYCNGNFDPGIYKIILRYDSVGSAVVDYVRTLYNKDKVALTEAINIAKTNSVDVVIIAKLMRVQIIDNVDTSFIANADDNVKNVFWKLESRLKIKESDNKDLFKWALKECSKYGNINTYSDLLFRAKDVISTEEIYKSFIEINRMAESGIIDLSGDNKNNLVNYYLEKVLINLQKFYEGDYEKCEKIAYIELLLRNILAWKDMKCLHASLKKSPKLYAEILQNLFRVEGEESNDKKRDLAGSYYALYHYADFCPAEHDGIVEYDKLKNWLDEFRRLLKEHKQEYLFKRQAGKLLAYSPKGSDGYYPCEAVRKIIDDDNYYDDEFRDAFIIAEENKQGIRDVDDGKISRDKAQFYSDTEKYFKVTHNRIAEIYKMLSEQYKVVSETERVWAENEIY